MRSVYPVKIGLCFKLTVPSQVLFLVFGICFLPARAAPTGIRNYSDPIPNPTNTTDPVPHPTNADCSASKDLIQKVIFSEGFLIIIVVFTTSSTLIIICIQCIQGNYGNHRVLGDPERAPLLEEYVQNHDENSKLSLNSEYLHSPSTEV
ncbi:uncharacterized protein RBU57_017280 [Macrochelys suwanniensis]